MKKILVVASILLTVNSFSAQVLGDSRANFGIFTDKEVKNLVFGNYNLDKEVVSLGKVKGTDSVASEKANKGETRPPIRTPIAITGKMKYPITASMAVINTQYV